MTHTDHLVSIIMIEICFIWSIIMHLSKCLLKILLFFSLLLVFSESSRYVSVSEPLSGMTTVTLNVTREGGALGLAFVDYNVTSASG